MSFTYPIFLWGLTAMSIPVIIHLFNFRKAKRINFSNVRFLEKIQKKSSSQRRLRHLLILLCRLLFIFFLVLTFAQPFVPSQESGLQSRSVTLYLDNSYSLSNLTTNDISGLNEQLGMAQQIVSLYPEETLFSLITNDFAPGSGNYTSKTKTLEKLTEIEFSSLSRSGQEVFNKFLSQEDTKPKDIFILSDFQQATLGDFKSFRDTVNYYHFVRPALAEARNISVDTIYLANPFLIPGQKNKIHLRIRNQGTAITDLQLKLYINDKQSGTTTIDLDGNSHATVSFELTGSLLNINRCQISFQDFPISFDNDYFFTLSKARRIKIVEISSKKGGPIEKVYQDNELFDFSNFHAENISYPALEKADLLIINGLSTLENGLKAQVEKQLAEGRSVVFIPGGDALSYHFSGLGILKDSISLKVPLELPDIKNPFFDNMFESLSADIQMPLVVPMYTWSENESKLLQTKLGHVFLSQIFPLGKLYMFNTPLITEYTNFHQHALFVPIMQRLAESSGTNYPSLAYSVDNANLVLSVDSLPSRQLYKLKKEDSELIPSQRRRVNELVLDMPKYLLTPGFYDLMLDQTLVTTIGLNHSKKESEMAPMAVDEISARFSALQNLNVYQPTDATSFSEKLKEKYQQRELWKYALILSLIFLFAESVLLRFL